MTMMTPTVCECTMQRSSHRVRCRRRMSVSRWSSLVALVLSILVGILCSSQLLVVAATTTTASNNNDNIFDDLHIQQAVDYATALLEKSKATNSDIIQGIQRHDIHSVYKIGKHMVENADTDTADHTAAMQLLHTLADDSTAGHIKAQVALGFAYYNQKLSDKALAYFEQAGQDGPHQAALFNAGRIYAELDQWVPAMAYFRGAATLVETHPDSAQDSLTETCRQAFLTLSESLAAQELTIRQAADIFLYGSLQDELSPENEAHWTESVSSQIKLDGATDATVVSSAVATAFRHLRSIWEEASDKLSPLQAHILLTQMNRVLLTASTLDDDYCPAAAGYAEALGLSTYCYKQGATSSQDFSSGQCFNVAMATAASYYRRANDNEGLERVYQWAANHPTAASHWKIPEQSPAFFDTKLTSQPVWNTTDFATVAALERAYQTEFKSIEAEIQALQSLGMQTNVETNARGETVDSQSAAVGFQNLVPSPYRGARVVDSDDTRRLGGWTELELMQRGTWNDAHCRLVTTPCETLKSKPESLCTHSPPDCDSVVNLVRLESGTTAHVQGNTNGRLELYFGLQGCKGATIRLFGGEASEAVVDGGAVVVDPSFQHSVVHDGPESCYMLTAQIAHPERWTLNLD